MHSRRRGQRFGALLGIALAAAGAGATTTRQARGQDASAGRADVVVAGSDADASAILAAVREPLGDLGLVVRPARAGDSAASGDPAAQGARARIWIDARPHDHVDVIVAVPDRDRTRSATRSVPRTEALPVVVEQVAYVVRATLEALLAEPAPVRREPQPPARTSPPFDPPTPPAARRGFALDAVGFGTARATGASPSWGAGGALDMAPWGRAAGGPSFWLGTAVDAPFESSNDRVTMQTEIVAVRALGDIGLAHLGPVRLAVGAGGGVDVFRAVPLTAGASSVTLAGPTTRVDALLALRFVASVRIPSGPSFLVVADLDYDMAPPRYQVMEASAPPSTVLTPWRFRPGGELGLSVPLFGSEP